MPELTGLFDAVEKYMGLRARTQQPSLCPVDISKVGKDEGLGMELDSGMELGLRLVVVERGLA